MERKPFNWSLLTRDALYSMLNAIQSNVIDKKLTVNQLHTILSRHIKRHLPIKIRLDRDLKNEKGYVYVGGTYYSEKDWKNTTSPIEIIFSYNSEQKWFRLSRHRWIRICSLFADTMLHEIIHARQYRSRNFKDIPGYQSTAYYARDRKEQNYYGDTDEIGAFSFNIACELIDMFEGNFGEAVKYLDSNQYRRQKRTSFYKYMKAFDHNHEHTVIRRVKKKTISYLQTAYYYGKPFRTNNYLTY